MEILRRKVVVLFSFRSLSTKNRCCICPNQNANNFKHFQWKYFYHVSLQISCILIRQSVLSRRRFSRANMKVFIWKLFACKIHLITCVLPLAIWAGEKPRANFHLQWRRSSTSFTVSTTSFTRWCWADGDQWEQPVQGKSESFLRDYRCFIRCIQT